MPNELKDFGNPLREWVIESEVTVRVPRLSFVIARTAEEARAKKERGEIERVEDGPLSDDPVSETITDIRTGA
jgi:hypothetical protein